MEARLRSQPPLRAPEPGPWRKPRVCQNSSAPLSVGHEWSALAMRTINEKSGRFGVGDYVCYIDHSVIQAVFWPLSVTNETFATFETNISIC